jgi:hypothetical protein
MPLALHLEGGRLLVVTAWLLKRDHREESFVLRGRMACSKSSESRALDNGCQETLSSQERVNYCVQLNR